MARRPAPCSTAPTLCRQMLVVLLAASALLPGRLQGVLSLRCVLSGMCSLGETQPFTGDVGTTSGLKAALAARAYKRELIIMVTKPRSMLAARMALDHFQRLGFAHVLLMADNEADCAVVAMHAPDTGCAWDRFQLPTAGTGVSDMASLWHVRYRTLLRAIRLRYNVLSTDSDIILFDDPYRYFKSPPFSDYTIINQAEALYDEDAYRSNIQPNGGIIYVQNAAPDGPAAYVLGETLDRPLRFLDDGLQVLRANGLHVWCDLLDQDALCDALSSVTIGRPLFLFATQFCWDAAHSDPQRRDKVSRATRRAVSAAWRTGNAVPLPQWMRGAAGNDTTLMRWVPMVMPHAHGVWPDKYGGRLLPETRGPMSLAFRELLRNDTDAPLWPDPEDPGAEGAAAATPHEKYLFAPPWLIYGYLPRGTSGAWLPSADGNMWSPPQQVIGHAHYLPPADTALAKVVVRQVMGMYDWRLAGLLGGGFTLGAAQPAGDAIYFANRHTGLVPGRERDHVATALPRLLVLHPRLHLAGLASYTQLLAVLDGAMQLAALSNRTLVWPDLPCTVPWIAGLVEGAAGRIRQARRGEWYPRGVRTPNGSNVLCLFSRVIHVPCLHDLRGMLSTEYEHYRAMHGVRYDMQPSPGNTAFLPVHDQLVGPLHLDPGGPARAIVEVARSDAMRHLSHFNDAQVLFLAHPIKVRGMQREESMYAQCLPQLMRDEVTRRESGVVTAIHVVPGELSHGRLNATRLPPPWGLPILTAASAQQQAMADTGGHAATRPQQQTVDGTPPLGKWRVEVLNSSLSRILRSLLSRRLAAHLA